MKAYFDTKERIARLLYQAELWLGTPWCANSEARGKGVSCHNLPRAIYVACGALPESFPHVKGDPNGTRHRKVSVIEPWLDKRPEFIRLSDGDRLKAGDLVGLQIYRCLDHLGVVLTENLFVHVLMHKHTDCDLISVPPWSQHIRGAWRPLAWWPPGEADGHRPGGQETAANWEV